MSTRKVFVAGAGAWGTALALVARRAGNDVLIQAHEPEVADAVNGGHGNPVYLPGVALDPDIRATTDLAGAAGADLVLLVTPAQFLRVTCAGLAPHLADGTPVVVCAKGIEAATGALMSEVLAQTLPAALPAVLSGPTFAAEVARELPTAVTLACADAAVAADLAEALATPRFRIYRSGDVIGAEVGGAVKNVLAIACGIVQGRGLGDNARAALITRGIAEIARLGAALGGRPETLMGLSGIGDITLTCNAMQSRNFSLGVALGGGESLDDVLGRRVSVAEGVYTAAAVVALAGRRGVEMPICAAVDGILNGGADIDAAIQGLLARPMRAEDAPGR
ncbi:MAG: NAD(P)-dependent glycerol-3-phosphate dehydrogenase [Hyphomicrobiales bacterium]|nr:NAD(P)-dependent glycerol-3-phosphate dehydrogenase [Hyphomicrobiales bacterium]MCP5370417.1 NAD(P)-dependent glycerol-3-phosphate dehydrogenase [Hyphomicrobiales bacterium]